ncbi:MAG: isochorismatase family cysteine hydrolase [Thermodesulfobacteriota bacterium]
MVKIMQKPELRRDNMAVIVVDMQNDFVSKGGKFVENSPGYYQAAQAIIGPIAQLVEEASAAKVPVIFTQTHYQRGHADAGLISLSRELDALQRGSWGAQILEELTKAAGDNFYIVEKQRYNSFYGTNLEILLRGLRVQTLILTGIASNICVESTARAARDADFFPVALTDCSASFTPELHQAAMTNIDRFFGSAAELKDVLPIIGGTK